MIHLYSEIGLQDEVAIIEGPVSWSWVVPHVELVRKNHELAQKVHEIARLGIHVLAWKLHGI